MKLLKAESLYTNINSGGGDCDGNGDVGGDGGVVAVMVAYYR